MFGKTNKLKPIYKLGFLTPKDGSTFSRLSEATLTIYPNGIHVVTRCNEVYEVVPGEGPRYAVKDDTERGYAEFLAVE